MKRLLLKTGRFFWSRGFLKFILWSITIIVLLYVEEDWRGARDWAATKAEWEARGVSFDRKSYVPPEVPESQNLGSLLLFRMEAVKTNDGSTDYEEIELLRAMRRNLPGNQLPSIGRAAMAGKLADMGAIRSKIAADYAEAFKVSSPPPDALAQFDALYPFVSELRRAAKTRPYFRIDQDYLQPLPAGRALGQITDQILVSKVLTLHAILALDSRQPDIALSDITLNMEITSGVLQDPSLVGGLVGIGMVAIVNAAIYDGISLHAWNDAQLAQLQDELGRIDFLRSFQFAMRSEVVAEAVPNFDFIKNTRFAAARKGFYRTGYLINYFIVRDGWLDQNKSRFATVLFQSAEVVNPQSHKVNVEAVDDLQKKVEIMSESWLRFAPWNLLSAISISPVIRAAQKFAEGQAYWIDETRIVCALERYRLSHGAYPSSLDALVPASISELPRDIITGEPYHYQLRPDGTFLLYSVGWNQADDGGKIVYKNNSTSLDYEKGDWVWTIPKP